ncbi:hypothetical protein SLEP1_g55418 [Rubroshorea leprosula]|uniref:Uncharacterized protein n=1 Tax=Rubroshorea leprosula TaxID=152421 RepID=A0AAV5MFP6_9ROSI|nr:hypothetical protein SLEP1_g55418 [Rubroshorea leprosula]
MPSCLPHGPVALNHGCGANHDIPLATVTRPAKNVQLILGIAEERYGDWPWKLNLTSSRRYIKEIELTHVDFYNFHSCFLWDIQHRK